ncbi:hypothetical protein H1R20_g10622, partial [Candolleomyces eurysporus]
MAALPDGISYEVIVRAYISIRYMNYVVVSSFALLVADFLHTFPDEVQLMWKAPVSLVKILFFFLRYFSLVQGTFSLTYSIPINLSAAQCHSALVRDVDLELQMLNLVCIPERANVTFLGITFSLLLCSITVVMLCMLYIMFRNYRHCKTSTLVYSSPEISSVEYECFALVLACANVTVLFTLKGEALSPILVQPETSIHAILSTRMILRLRSWAERPYHQGRHIDGGGGSTWAVPGLEDRSYPIERIIFAAPPTSAVES